jgi:hypothetical protein
MIMLDTKHHTEVTADEFIAGQPVDYIGFDGKSYCAMYNNRCRTLPALTIMAVGMRTKDLSFAEHEARSFFANLSLKPE